MKKSVAAVIVLLFGVALAQSDKELRQSIDAQLAPRSLLLSGGYLDSKSGQYMIEFPAPNDCVLLGPVKAKSRSFALYRAVSDGGFTLKPSNGGVTVWTIEEWNHLKKEPWFADFEKARQIRCGTNVSR